MGSVYEATQVSLRRAVALRIVEARRFESPFEVIRFDQRQRLTAPLTHPNLVPYYEAGTWEGGRFVATRLIRGRTLASLRADGTLPAAGSLAPLEGALKCAHLAGLTHGRVTEENILIERDGTPYLSDLGLGHAAYPEADELALADIISSLPSDAVAKVRIRRWLAPAAGLVAVAAAALGFALNSDSGVATLGCADVPSQNTPACTLAATSRGGEPLELTRGGVIRSWSVTGGSGDISLQVIRRRPDGSFFAARFSQPESLGGADSATFDASIPVRAGDLIGARLGPGATIGSASVSGAGLMRWDGGLTVDSASPDGTPLEGELLLTAEVAYGERHSPAGLLSGTEAATSQPGQVLADVRVTLGKNRAGTAALVELPDGIAIDIFRGDSRLSRLDVPDAEPAGELQGLEGSCGRIGAKGFCLRWLNPGDELTLFHSYSVDTQGRLKEIG